MSVFVALEGIDGVGKSTIAKKISEEYDDWIFISKKSICNTDSFVRLEMETIAGLMWKNDFGKNDHQIWEKYYIFLQATWYSLLFKYVIEPELKNGKNIIIDGWFYKFLAKIKSSNAKADLIESLFHDIGGPNHVILLDEQPLNAYKKKKVISAYEFGTHHGYKVNSVDSFTSFQGMIKDNLMDLSRELKWEIINVENKSIEENIQMVSRCLEKINEGEKIEHESFI